MTYLWPRLQPLGLTPVEWWVAYNYITAADLTRASFCPPLSFTLRLFSQMSRYPSGEIQLHTRLWYDYNIYPYICTFIDVGPNEKYI
jgi:hypothetical protein